MKRILALVLCFALLFSLVACNRRAVPSSSDVKAAVQEEYDMKFKLDSEKIAKDESKATWVFISKDGTLEVTVTWEAKHPKEFNFEDKDLAVVPSKRDVQNAVEEEYGMSFWFNYESISEGDKETTGEWVFYSEDETLEVTVTWSSKKPDKFNFSDRKIEKPTESSDPYDDDPDVPTYGRGSEVIELWSFTNEIPNMVAKYIELHPEFGEKYTVRCTIIATDGGAYQQALDQAIAAGGDKAPDMYAAEAAFILKYAQGDMAYYAATYKDLGIDVDNKIKSAEIAQYTVDIGTRDGEVVALGYQATGGAMIYRSSIAKEVFGTDDPDEIEKIFGAGTGNWDKFWDAAAKLKDKGYKVVSGADDIWNVCEKSATQAWFDKDYNITIAPEREAYFDIYKKLIDDDLSHDSGSWNEAWYANMGDSDVFCFFGPAWLINYVMVGQAGNTWGDWRVCTPPVGFFWGGTWVLADKDTDQAAGVAELIEWITLDTSETGLQYLWANDKMGNGAKDTVASAVVMGKSDGTLDFCGGQNVFEKFIEGNKYATGKAMTQYDEDINGFFKDAASLYAHGELPKDSAIQQFKDNVSSAFAL